MRRKIEANKLENKEKYWERLFKTQAREFCLATGLHGYKYIAQTERSKAERIVWCIIVLLSLGCAVALMTVAWEYNSQRQTITVIETTHRGIWNYPFPAVTVCNLNRVSSRGARNVVSQLKYSKDLSEEFLVSEMALLIELILPGVHPYDIEKNLTRLQNIFDDNRWTINEVLEKVSQNCSDLLNECKWKGSSINCSELFKASLSREGHCCSFNYIDTKDPRIPTTVEPKHLPSCGYQTGLTMHLNVDPDDYMAAIMGSYAVKVLVHYPYDYADYNAENKLVGLGSQVFISVSPEEMYSAADVRHIPMKTRQCIFADKKNVDENVDIKQFNFTYVKYTYKNCLTRCRATTIKKLCQCIPYYYYQTGTRVCTLRDVQCLRTHSAVWENSWPGIPIDPYELVGSTGDEKLWKVLNNPPCGCKADCGLYRYPLESSRGPTAGSLSHGDLESLPNDTVRNKSVVHIFFSDLMSIQYRRSVSFNWLNMLASFGGLLGLFVGFSIMSAYELIYFFVIRVIGDASMKRKRNFSLETSEIVRFDEKIHKRRRF